MSVKEIVQGQYTALVNRAAHLAHGVEMPPEGWVRTVRRALGMSGAQLGRRLAVTRGNIANLEKAELSGSVTIKTLQELARAMECRFVYAMVPDTTVDEILRKRARTKAEQIVSRASKQMALEDQTLSKSQMEFEITRLQQELLKDRIGRLWDDEA